MNWFKHDTDTTTDAKIKKLILKHGAIGYAVYFHCLELIAGDINESNITFQLEHDSEIIADNLKISGTADRSGVEVVQAIMLTMIDLKLFEEDRGKIYCYKLLKRLDVSMTSNQKMRELIKNAKENHDGIMTHHDRIMTNPDFIMQEEKRREEIRKEENRNTLSVFAEQNPDGVQKSTIKKYPCEEVLSYLNLKAGKRFTLTKDHKAFIESRFKDGFSLDDFKKVIDNKVLTWKTDPKFNAYLRPETLFRPSHFQSYLNETPTTGEKAADDVEAFLARRRAAQ